MGRCCGLTAGAQVAVVVFKVAVKRLEFAVGNEAEFVAGGAQQAAVVRDDEHGAVVVL